MRTNQPGRQERGQRQLEQRPGQPPNPSVEPGFLRTVLAIALPVGLQSMLQSSFGMVDQLMVGRLGSTAVAAVEAAGRPVFILTVMVGAAAAIAGVMIAQYLGMRSEQMADRSLSLNLALAGGLAVLWALPCLLVPGRIVGLFLPDDAAARAAGQAYLSCAAWGFLPGSLSAILAVMIRCMGRPNGPLTAGFFAAALNTCLNALLIFGGPGLPALGVRGAAIASVLSQWAGLLMLLRLFARLRRGRRFCFSPALGAGGGRRYFTMLLPVLLNELLWSLGQSLNTFIYGRLAPGSLAAAAITGPVQGLFIGALSGISQAAGILIGRRLGAGEEEKAYREAWRLTLYGAAGSLALSALLTAGRGLYVGLFRVEPAVQAMAGQLLLAFAALAPVKVANMVLGGGVLRSGGKTGYIFAIDLIGTWLVGAPLGLWAGLGLQLPVVWVYFILSQEELVRLGLTLLTFRRRGWMARLKPGENAEQARGAAP